MPGLNFVDLLGADPHTRMQPVLVITRLHTTVKFEAKDKDRCLNWYFDDIRNCYFQLEVLSFLDHCKRKQKNAYSG
jgi:deoxyadenosine/deoxycytidine kinase